MIEQQMKRTARAMITTGIVLQAGGFFDAFIEPEPHWMECYLLSLVLVLVGYYLGLQGKGYRPYRLPSFYGMLLAVIVPYVGAVALARSLFMTPQQGTIPAAKKWQVSLWSFALFIAILIALASLSLPGFIAEKKKQTGSKQAHSFSGEDRA